MDAWILRHKRQSYDRNVDFACSGHTVNALLEKLLSDDYFRFVPPKSTGYEYFNLAWLEKYLDKELASEKYHADIQSTLCDLTAISISRAIEQYCEATDEIFVCGGRAHNKELMRRLRALCSTSVSSTEAPGIHPEWVEAMAFAWLAYQYNHQLTGNLPSVTGARKAVILGKKTTAR